MAPSWFILHFIFEFEHSFRSSMHDGGFCVFRFAPVTIKCYKSSPMPIAYTTVVQRKPENSKFLMT